MSTNRISKYFQTDGFLGPAKNRLTSEGIRERIQSLRVDKSVPTTSASEFEAAELLKNLFKPPGVEIDGIATIKYLEDLNILNELRDFTNEKKIDFNLDESTVNQLRDPGKNVDLIQVKNELAALIQLAYNARQDLQANSKFANAELEIFKQLVDFLKIQCFDFDKKSHDKILKETAKNLDRYLSN